MPELKKQMTWLDESPVWAEDLQAGMRLLARAREEGAISSLLATKKPMWDGKADLAGKTVLLRGEEGFGDEIINVRFAKNFAERGATVVVSCRAGLLSVLSRVPGVSRAVPRESEGEVEFDYWVPMMTAPLSLGFTYKTLSGAPYLIPDHTYIEKWKNVINPKSGELRVGIRWAGNPQYQYDFKRHFPHEPLIALHTIPNVRVFSLQIEDNLEKLPPEVVDLRPELKSWEDTLAAVSYLDIVVSSCTSTAHLSAASGCETWPVVSRYPYYIWAQPGEKTPWYDTARIFREGESGWEATLANIRSEVEDRAKKKVSL